MPAATCRLFVQTYVQNNVCFLIVCLGENKHFKFQKLSIEISSISNQKLENSREFTEYHERRKARIDDLEFRMTKFNFK